MRGALGAHARPDPRIRRRPHRGECRALGLSAPRCGTQAGCEPEEAAMSLDENRPDELAYETTMSPDQMRHSAAATA
jgi:hypothetical protein